MRTDRRQFLYSAAAATTGALGLGFTAGNEGLTRAAAGPRARAVSKPQTPRSMSILILGGTNLTGPHNVRYALERGHTVTIFTRGLSEPGLFQDAFEHVEHLIGDRADNLEALRGRRWDAVIDASGMQVEWTRDSAELLADATDTYLYISSTGVYYPYRTTDIDEDTEPLLEDPSGGENGASAYGVMKALSEIEARKVFGDRTLIVRPGYIVGPLDTTHRGTYWPLRIRRGGEVMVPGRKTDQVQQIDVRDLTEWMIHLLETGTHGVFNATGPTPSPTTLEEFVYGVRATTSAEVSWTWIEDYDFLREHGVTYAIPWIMAHGDNLGSQTINTDRAQRAGLTFRPIARTSMDTLDWFDSLPRDERAAARITISRDKEEEVLAAWQTRAG